eukprot:gnl/MRDRNA2_/MRDRNA2_187166_c0_seq1.p1 gnl/MRDRNA2_/MRDRNA2_187166_c0~~gnl/MRDRNA2_/MRDRNA2_187166_c0_seq1.p1  ORF type:complete len:718 (-),score=185.94 gnl/MRDRNA2_/MRDRNA2_187166_c0_seq1:84-2006(-)
MATRAEAAAVSAAAIASGATTKAESAPPHSVAKSAASAARAAAGRAQASAIEAAVAVAEASARGSAQETASLQEEVAAGVERRIALVSAAASSTVQGMAAKDIQAAASEAVQADFQDSSALQATAVTLTRQTSIDEFPVTGDTVMPFGKHQGRTFEDLRANEPGYVSWALGQQDPSGGVLQFVEYLKANGESGGQGSGDLGSSAQLLPPTGDSVMTVGKYRGRTFADLKQNEPSFVSWALGQQPITSNLKSFIDFLQEEAVSRGVQTSSPVSSPTQPSLPASGDSVLTFGKYRGRTFADIKDNDPSYVAWALRQPQPRDHLIAFVEYLKAEGVSGSLQASSAMNSSTQQKMTVSGEAAQTFGTTQDVGAPSVLSNSSELSLPPTGDTMITFGKYRGRTFADIKDSDSSYVSWALGLQFPSPNLQPFIDYLQTEGVGQGREGSANLSASLQQPLPATGDTVRTQGKHKGRTFADLKDNEPAYVFWALGQPDLSPELQSFVDYLKASGVSAGLQVPSELSSPSWQSSTLTGGGTATASAAEQQNQTPGKQEPPMRSPNLTGGSAVTATEAEQQNQASRELPMAETTVTSGSASSSSGMEADEPNELSKEVAEEPDISTMPPEMQNAAAAPSLQLSGREQKLT